MVRIQSCLGGYAAVPSLLHFAREGRHCNPTGSECIPLQLTKCSCLRENHQSEIEHAPVQQYEAGEPEEHQLSNIGDIKYA
uniref:Uncharacterized protein n=1 Tax=Oryza meridionalis TaxID=40149 RepID=A0A0E0FBV2_9ORYZ